MTHRSSFAYGAPQLPEPHSGARSGEVRVSYFDPVTGRPCRRKPAPRSAQLKTAAERPPERGRGGWNFKPRKSSGTRCTVDGEEYESIAAAARATGISYRTLQKACCGGSSEAAGHSVSFGKRA